MSTGRLGVPPGSNIFGDCDTATVNFILTFCHVGITCRIYDDALRRFGPRWTEDPIHRIADGESERDDRSGEDAF